MKAKGIFMYKSVQRREKGKFTTETGEEKEYGSCNVLVADEILENGQIKERRLKFPETNKMLYEELLSVPAYTKIELTCDIALYASNAKIEPISFEIL